MTRELQIVDPPLELIPSGAKVAELLCRQQVSARLGLSRDRRQCLVVEATEYTPSAEVPHARVGKHCPP